jgi:putative ABC transport system permease protein
MISLLWTLRIALRALRANKMRSALTMLGIIIGVAAVIAMLAVGTGASRRVTQQIEGIGSNLLMVLPGATTSGGVRMGAGTQTTLTLSDAEAIKKDCPAVAYVAPVLSGVAQLVYGHQNWSTGVQGTTPDMLYVRDWPVAVGHAFTDQDVRSAAKVCLLGQTVADNLFGAMNPVGQVIRIKNIPFKVLGVLAVKGSPSRPPRRSCSERPSPAWSGSSWSRPGAWTTSGRPRPRSRPCSASGTISPPGRRMTSPSATSPS